MKISDIVEFNPTRTLKKGTLASFVEMAAVPEYVRDIAYVDEKEFSSGSKFKNGDTLFARITPCLENGKTAKVNCLRDDEIAHGSTEFIVMAPRSEDDEDFVYYLSRDPEFREFAKSRMQGTSGRQRVSWQSLADYELPDIEPAVRKRIGEILKGFDDKITLNREMNKTLEVMAQAIFKNWFVDFEPFRDGEFVESELGMIPKEWEVKTIDDVCDFQNGYAFKSKEMSEDSSNSYKVFKMGNIKKGGGLNKAGSKDYFPKDLSIKLDRYLVKKGDLLMCMTDMKDNVALLGHTALMDEDDIFILNQRVGLIRSKNKSIANYPFLYILTNSENFITDLRKRANSGVQVNLSTSEIKSTKFVLPPQKVHEEFDKIVLLFQEKIFKLDQENETLSNLRDTLLPKLLSGEIEV